MPSMAPSRPPEKARAASASASAGRPNRHGPHCPALSSARYRTTRAVSASGLAVNAALVRPWRGERGLARAAVQVLDDRGLLAGHVPAGDAGYLDRHFVPVEPGRLALGHRTIQMREQGAVGPVHAQVRLVGA